MTEMNADAIALAAALARQDPGPVLGSLLMSLLLVTFFMGLLSTQSLTYFQSFPNDSRWLKSLVILLIVLSIAQYVVVVDQSWMWFVRSYGNWNVVVSNLWPISWEIIVSQAINICVQMFYLRRCFVLGGHNAIAASLVGIACIGSMVLAVLSAVELMHDPYNTLSYQRYTIPSLAANVAIDVIITARTTYKLIVHQKGFNPETDSMLRKMMYLVWEAVVPPSISACANIVIYLVMDQPVGLFSLFNVLTPRLYVFGMMLSINSRLIFREPTECVDPKSRSSSSKGSRQPVPRNNTNVTTIVFAPTHTASTSIGTVDERSGVEMATVSRSKGELDNWNVETHETSDIVDLKSEDLEMGLRQLKI